MAAFPQEANITQAVPFFMVSNMERSLRYYVDGLGFVIKHRWVVDGKIRWCWLERGAAIMLQEFVPYADRTWTSFGTVGQGVSVCFICKDAIAFYREVKSREIEASEPQGGNGMWETGMTDPDGYRIFFESPTDVSEETKLSEVKEA